MNRMAYNADSLLRKRHVLIGNDLENGFQLGLRRVWEYGSPSLAIEIHFLPVLLSP